MKYRLAFCFCFLQFYFFALCSAKTTPTLDEILLRVQEHVKEFEFSLPDFVCNETITSKEILRGQVAHKTIIDSVFSGRQNNDGGTQQPFTEARTIRMIDGRPAGKDEQLKAPVLFGGGFSSILDATFSDKKAQYHNYKLIGTEKLNGRPTLVIEFATKKDQTELLFEFLGRKFISKDVGKAWLDPETLNVIRLERRYLNLPPLDGVLAVSVDFAKIEINGKTFWMPRTVRVEQSQPGAKKPVSIQYIAEYSDYQKFNVSSHIKY
ncbi:MAG: hypothetical protein DMG65_01355 [Candidatus Angelobacter sp. Gp1-AA117]|nr:MAG: hypothetical protein DMG65_01355 [Candidatus Angelobacter sp. Gp1-AA117]